MNIDLKSVTIEAEKTVLGFFGWAEKYCKKKKTVKYLQGKKDIQGLIANSILANAFIQQNNLEKEYAEFGKIWNDYYRTYQKGKNVIKNSK